jgi:outer membrane murein-binding lipoprotein Lpp
MDAIVIGAALFAALLVTFGVLRAQVRELSRAVEDLRIRVDALSEAAQPAPAPASPIDVEPFVD